MRRGRLVEVEFVRRKVHVERPCSHCKETLPVGSLFWRRGHVSLHIECFETLRDHGKAARAREGGSGRKPVLDAHKMAQVTIALFDAKEKAIDPNVRAIARHVGASERTVRRFINGKYMKKAA